MDAKVLWRGGLGFTGSAAESGFELPLGAEPAVGGAGDGFRPMELIAVGLAGCTAMDVISIMTKKRQDVTAFEVRVEAPRAEEHPKVFTRAVIQYEFTGHEIKEAAVRRAIELSAERYCPAQAMLGRIMPIRLDYAIYEEGSAQGRELVVEGTWSPDD
jgi:putative redox protein